MARLLWFYEMSSWLVQESEAPHVVLYGARGVICGAHLKSLLQPVPNLSLLLKARAGAHQVAFCNDGMHHGHHCFLVKGRQYCSCSCFSPPTIQNPLENIRNYLDASKENYSNHPKPLGNNSKHPEGSTNYWQASKSLLEITASIQPMEVRKEATRRENKDPLKESQNLFMVVYSKQTSANS